MNYFEILEAPISYKIDEQKITDVYLEKQRILHPDLQEKNHDDSDISLLNEAYHVLRSPILRAEYFLKLKGINTDAIVTSESASEILFLREQYESINSEAEIEKFNEYLQERMGNLIDSLYKLENNLEEFNKKFSLLRFIKSFLDRVVPDAYSGD
ncbi:MAG: Fe-S protein assembly co-chaperone HscB [Holosporaceae bacterium]|jgi:molecular chaperone HscB|nr:Fe-S protein assembly co-chaperone HscB [Holosporaceae bacterium]